MDGVRRHASQTGQIIWGWNFLQSGFLHIFHQLVAPSNHDLALALWHMIQSDKTQREMVLAAATAVLPENSRLLADIDWLVKRSQDLSPYRNDSAHTGISLGGEFHEGRVRMKIHPDQRSGRPPAVARLIDKPVESYWRVVKGDLWVLGRYASSLAGKVHGNSDYGPSLQRPRLLTVPPKKKHGRQKSHPPRGAKP